MLDVWSGLQAWMTAGVRVDLGLPAAIQGVLLGVFLGLALPLTLIGLGMLLDWSIQHRPHGTRLRLIPGGRRAVMPLDDWRPDFEQFTARELARLQCLRRIYADRRDGIVRRPLVQGMLSTHWPRRVGPAGRRFWR
jgi:hypothetical protein